MYLCIVQSFSLDSEMLIGMYNCIGLLRNLLYNGSLLAMDSFVFFVCPSCVISDVCRRVIRWHGGSSCDDYVEEVDDPFLFMLDRWHLGFK